MWTGSFGSEVQSSVDHGASLQSVGPADPETTAAGDSSRPCSCLQVMFSQARPPSFSDGSWAHQQDSAAATNQFAMPTITLNNGAITDKIVGVAHSNVSSIENNSSSTREAKKGVIYPSYFDDIMAGVSFGLGFDVPSE